MHEPTFDGRLKPPQQERSRETLERILGAVERLMDGRPFDDISVQEIIDEAEVSRSSFYARFPSKQDVLPRMYRRYVDRATLLLTTALDPDGGANDPELLVERLVRGYARFVNTFEQTLISFEHAELGSRHGRTRDAMTARVVDIYLASVGETGNRQYRDCVGFITRAIAAVLMRALGGPSAFDRALGFDEERLIQEIISMANSYLAEADRRFGTSASAKTSQVRPPQP